MPFFLQRAKLTHVSYGKTHYMTEDEEDRRKQRVLMDAKDAFYALIEGGTRSLSKEYIAAAISGETDAAQLDGLYRSCLDATLDLRGPEGQVLSPDVQKKAERLLVAHIVQPFFDQMMVIVRADDTRLGAQGVVRNRDSVRGAATDLAIFKDYVSHVLAELNVGGVTLDSIQVFDPQALCRESFLGGKVLVEGPPQCGKSPSAGAIMALNVATRRPTIITGPIHRKCVPQLLRKLQAFVPDAIVQEVTCAADLESNIERFKDCRFIPFVMAENAAFIPDVLVDKEISNCTGIIDESDENTTNVLGFNEDKPCDYDVHEKRLSHLDAIRSAPDPDLARRQESAAFKPTHDKLVAMYNRTRREQAAEDMAKCAAISCIVNITATSASLITDLGSKLESFDGTVRAVEARLAAVGYRGLDKCSRLTAADGTILRFPDPDTLPKKVPCRPRSKFPSDRDYAQHRAAVDAENAGNVWLPENGSGIDSEQVTSAIELLHSGALVGGDALFALGCKAASSGGFYYQARKIAQVRLCAIPKYKKCW